MIDESSIRELVDIERTIACLFDSGCNSPVGCYAETKYNNIILHGNFFCNGKNYRDKVYLDEVKEKNELANKLYDKINKKIQMDIHQYIIHKKLKNNL